MVLFSISLMIAMGYDLQSGVLLDYSQLPIMLHITFKLERSMIEQLISKPQNTNFCIIVVVMIIAMVKTIDATLGLKLRKKACLGTQVTSFLE